MSSAGLEAPVRSPTRSVLGVSRRFGDDVLADFDPWAALRWPTVRALRYRQHKPPDTVVEAYWLTDFPAPRVSSPTLFRLARSRWEVENQAFNESKTALSRGPRTRDRGGTTQRPPT